MPGQHCNSCSSVSGQKKEEKEGCRINREEAFFLHGLEKEKDAGIDDKAF